ncbi:hypothetical protein [Janibacter melonis]|uniref:hypothetical protein n=1 Tax=Janibacter melonis TaxID=262209 RepID=UPI0035584986
MTIDGTRYLSDPGIGVPPLAPVELRDGARLEGGIWEHEIRRVDEGEPARPGSCGGSGRRVGAHALDRRAARASY